MKTLILSVSLSFISLAAFSQLKGGGQPQRETTGFSNSGASIYGNNGNSVNYNQPIHVTPVPGPTPVKQLPGASDKAPQPKPQPIDANKGNCTVTATETYYIYTCPKCGYQSQFAGRCPKDSTLLESKACVRATHK